MLQLQWVVKWSLNTSSRRNGPYDGQSASRSGRRHLGIGTSLPVLLVAFAVAMATCVTQKSSLANESARVNTSMPQGVCLVLGLPEVNRPESVVDIAANTGMLVYFQAAEENQVHAVRDAAATKGILGKRVFAEHGDLSSIHLANNLADRVYVAPDVQNAVSEREVLRVLCPGGEASVGDRLVTKPAPDGIDNWSHVYHGPDNNPQSRDHIARAPYRTQFLAAPLFSPMPEVTVAAGGRIFKAFGHIAHKANQNAVLNTLFCISAYNGGVLWTRPLNPDFMIHRSTMIATPDQFYLADDKSCKLIDPKTGQVRDEIVISEGIADGPVWKWMALHEGVLYALVGAREFSVDTITSNVRGIGHWPWGMWKGHDYSDPRKSFGFGRTFLAINPTTKEILWNYSDTEYIDSRGVCMSGGKIYFYSPEKFLGCIDAASGDVLWKNSDESLLQAIGPNGPAQHYVTGYATTSYIKCNDKQIFFAGPQRPRFVVASTEDGRVLWQKPQGNVQVVLRDDGIYCAGPQRGDDTAGAKYAYDGRRLTSLPIRRACTRATGSIDGIFYRTTGGTVRFNVATNSAEHIAPMRPPCQDGVIISAGYLFWGPWMCGCQLSLYGHISLGPANAAPPAAPVPEPQRLTSATNLANVTAFPIANGDWPAYLHDEQRSGFTRAKVPASIQLAWQRQVVVDDLPTAPVVAGDTVFVADRSGTVQAVGSDGKPRWSFRAAGPVYYPPTLDNGRLFFGSADGRVYALEASNGRFLWSYRMSPESRWIPVYGRLMSTWPVAGGVVVRDGAAFAAAGIAHYDGIYVAALDAATGKVRWSNTTSGVLSKDVNCGVSLQGELQVRGDELQFLGGGAYQIARYDLQTGKCLNTPRHEVTSMFQTAFYPYFPTYAKYASLNHTFPDGRTLQYSASYDGSHPQPMVMLAPRRDETQPHADGPGKAKVPSSARRDRASRRPQRPHVWQTKGPQLFTALVVTPDVLLTGGPGAKRGDQPQLTAVSLKDGSVLWQQSLESLPVKAGIALDGKQRIIVTLENGQLLCFTP